MAITRRILVAGATGKQGGALISALLSSKTTQSFKIIALTRNTKSARAHVLSKKPNITLLQGDLNDCSAIFRNVKEPVDTVFSVQVPLKPAVEELQGKNLVDAAAANGVKHFIYTSVERGGKEQSDRDGSPVPHFISKFNIENHLKSVASAKGMTWTIIRPVTFMDNLTPNFLGKAFATMWKINGLESKLQLVSSADIGKLAAEAFKSPERYSGKAISFAVDELTYREANQIFKKFAGTDIPTTYTWIGRSLRYALYQQLGIMFDWFKDVGFGADVKEFNGKINGLQSFDLWLRTSSRRRKIKCTYFNYKPSACDQCSENGRLCKSQGIISGSKTAAGADKWTGLKIRISRLESRVEGLSRLPSTQLSNLTVQLQSETQIRLSPAPDTKLITEVLENQFNKKPPMLELFSNELLLTKDNAAEPPNLHCVIDFGPSEFSDSEKLISIISKETDIMCVLDIASTWWEPWRNFYPGLRELAVANSLRGFASFNLAQRKPVLIATGLLCIAMSLQHIRPGIDDQNLNFSESATELINRITAAVDQIVLNNDDHVSCFEGVLILLLRGKLHAESNQLRKAWLGIRRSILLAQKIGLAPPQPHRAAIGIQCQQFVDSMFETDRFFSMFLGMPYALDKNFGDAHGDRILSENSSIDKRMRSLRRVTAIAAEKINDRDSGPEESAFNLTTKIQNLMETARDSMSPEWWTISSHLTSISNPPLAHEHLQTQLWFYQTQCFLHLRYMLKATSNLSFESNRKSCLEASRNLVKVWITLRQNAMLSVYTCRLDDFQGLTSVLIILIGLLQCLSQGSNPEYSGAKSDMDLITAAKEVFRHVAQEQSGSIARQSVRVIETLSSFIQFEDCLSTADEDSTLIRRNATLFVPYFGAISIESRPFTVSKQTLPIPQSHQSYPNPSKNVPLYTSTTDGDSDHKIDILLSEDNFGYGESLHAHENQNMSFMAYQPIEKIDNTSDILPAWPKTVGALPAAPSPGLRHPQLGASGLGSGYNEYNWFSTEVVLDWDKIMTEVDPNQDWDMSFAQYVDL